MNYEVMFSGKFCNTSLDKVTFWSSFQVREISTPSMYLSVILEICMFLVYFHVTIFQNMILEHPFLLPVCYGQTDGLTNPPRDTASYRDARP